ncbi:predicted protein [Postia placenta Mad-698-R]|nr:predicted protein [Postia placenta Mad-698-R]
MTTAKSMSAVTRMIRPRTRIAPQAGRAHPRVAYWPRSGWLWLAALPGIDGRSMSSSDRQRDAEKPKPRPHEPSESQNCRIPRVTVIERVAAVRELAQRSRTHVEPHSVLTCRPSEKSGAHSKIEIRIRPSAGSSLAYDTSPLSAPLSRTPANPLRALIPRRPYFGDGLKSARRRVRPGPLWVVLRRGVIDDKLEVADGGTNTAVLAVREAVLRSGRPQSGGRPGDVGRRDSRDNGLYLIEERRRVRDNQGGSANGRAHLPDRTWQSLSISETQHTRQGALEHSPGSPGSWLFDTCITTRVPEGPQRVFLFLRRALPFPLLYFPVPFPFSLAVAARRADAHRAVPATSPSFVTARVGAANSNTPSSSDEDAHLTSPVASPQPGPIAQSFFFAVPDRSSWSSNDQEPASDSDVSSAANLAGWGSGRRMSVEGNPVNRVQMRSVMQPMLPTRGPSRAASPRQRNHRRSSMATEYAYSAGIATEEELASPTSSINEHNPFGTPTDTPRNSIYGGQAPNLAAAANAALGDKKTPPSAYSFPFQSHPGNPDPGLSVPGRRTSAESLRSRTAPPGMGAPLSPNVTNATNNNPLTPPGSAMGTKRRRCHVIWSQRDDSAGGMQETTHRDVHDDSRGNAQPDTRRVEKRLAGRRAWTIADAFTQPVGTRYHSACPHSCTALSTRVAPQANMICSRSCVSVRDTSTSPLHCFARRPLSRIPGRPSSGLHATQKPAAQPAAWSKRARAPVEARPMTTSAERSTQCEMEDVPVVFSTPPSRTHCERADHGNHSDQMGVSMSARLGELRTGLRAEPDARPPYTRAVLRACTGRSRVRVGDGQHRGFHIQPARAPSNCGGGQHLRLIRGLLLIDGNGNSDSDSSYRPRRYEPCRCGAGNEQFSVHMHLTANVTLLYMIPLAEPELTEYRNTLASPAKETRVVKGVPSKLCDRHPLSQMMSIAMSVNIMATIKAKVHLSLSLSVIALRMMANGRKHVFGFQWDAASGSQVDESTDGGEMLCQAGSRWLVWSQDPPPDACKCVVTPTKEPRIEKPIDGSSEPISLAWNGSAPHTARASVSACSKGIKFCGQMLVPAHAAAHGLTFSALHSASSSTPRVLAVGVPGSKTIMTRDKDLHGTISRCAPLDIVGNISACGRKHFDDGAPGGFCRRDDGPAITLECASRDPERAAALTDLNAGDSDEDAPQTLAAQASDSVSTSTLQRFTSNRRVAGGHLPRDHAALPHAALVQEHPWVAVVRHIVQDRALLRKQLACVVRTSGRVYGHCFCASVMSLSRPGRQQQPSPARAQEQAPAPAHAQHPPRDLVLAVPAPVRARDAPPPRGAEDAGHWSDRRRCFSAQRLDAGASGGVATLSARSAAGCVKGAVRAQSRGGSERIGHGARAFGHGRSATAHNGSARCFAPRAASSPPPRNTGLGRVVLTGGSACAKRSGRHRAEAVRGGELTGRGARASGHGASANARNGNTRCCAPGQDPLWQRAPLRTQSASVAAVCALASRTGWDGAAQRLCPDAQRWTRSRRTDQGRRVLLRCASDSARSMLTGRARRTESAGGGTVAGRWRARRERWAGQREYYRTRLVLYEH